LHDVEVDEPHTAPELTQFGWHSPNASHVSGSSHSVSAVELHGVPSSTNPPPEQSPLPLHSAANSHGFVDVVHAIPDDT
jgi:hypothetical protein